MSSAFLGEIRIVGFNFAPQGWAQCNGQFLPINQNQGLFSLLGTQFGGNGQTTFALPDFRGRVPIHMGAGHTIGEAAGSASVTVNVSQLPTHTHVLNCTTAAATADLVTGNLPAQPANLQIYGNGNLVSMNPGVNGSTGGSQPHENRQPYTVLTFCIALQGIFPAQS